MKIAAAIILSPLIVIAVVVLALLSLPFLCVSTALLAFKEGDAADWVFDHTPLTLVVCWMSRQ